MKRQFSQISDRAILFLATGFYVGYFPWFPAQFGTLIGIPIFGLLSIIDIKLRFFIVVLITLSSIWIAGKAEKILGNKDPQSIIIDEIIGYNVATFFVAFNLKAICISFVLFRFFDTLKPFPIFKLQKLGGGLGIVIDDVFAGLYVLLIMAILT
jgi:phosphatidylglycerophosphatase A